MSLRAVARQHGNRGAGRTRFPSVNALSEFSHNQGQLLTPPTGVGHSRIPPVSGPSSTIRDQARQQTTSGGCWHGASVTHSDLSTCSIVRTRTLELLDHLVGTRERR